MKLVDIPERHLPSDFADRLVQSVRRRKHARRMRLAVVLVVVGVLGMGLIDGFCGRDEDRSPRQAQLVAAQDTSRTNETKVTSLLMLSFFKECFKRNRSWRKKEEED